MVVFVHFKQKKIKSFSDKIILLHKDYKDRSFYFDRKIKDLFAEMQDFFNQIGDSKYETLVSQLSIYFETSLKGIHPLRLEKIKTGRRENIWISAFHCLTTLTEIVQENLENINKPLDEAKEILSQFVLSAIQNHLITQEQIQEVNNIRKIESLWNKLKQNQQISLLDRKLRLTITNNDIYLLLDEIFSTIE